MDGMNVMVPWPAASDVGGPASTAAPSRAAALDSPTEPPTGEAHRLGDPPAPSLEARAKAAAEKLESFFIAQMLRQMRSGANQFADEGSAAKDPLNADMLSLADGLLADSLAGRHAFGIADAILRQLTPKAEEAVFQVARPA